VRSHRNGPDGFDPVVGEDMDLTIGGTHHFPGSYLPDGCRTVETGQMSGREIGDDRLTESSKRGAQLHVSVCSEFPERLSLGSKGADHDASARVKTQRQAWYTVLPGTRCSRPGEARPGKTLQGAPKLLARGRVPEPRLVVRTAAQDLFPARAK